MQEQMLGGKGFLVIGYLLEKVCTSRNRTAVSCLSATFITILLSYLSVFILTESKNRDLNIPKSLEFHITHIFSTLFLIPASSGAASCD